MGRERTEGERLAAREFADAVRTEAERFFDAVVEEVRRNPRGFSLRPEPLTEEEADELALSAVHRARDESPRGAEDHLPSGAEVRSWAEDRELGRSEGRTARVWNPTPPR